MMQSHGPEAFEKRTGQLVDDVDNILLTDTKKIALVHDAEGDVVQNVARVNSVFGVHAGLSFVLEVSWMLRGLRQDCSFITFRTTDSTKEPDNNCWFCLSSKSEEA
jgi:hypothetical protein